MMSFKIDYDNISKYTLPTLMIKLIGHYSIDGDLQYRDDLSQLKYYIPPSDPNDVCYDLNKDFPSTHRKPTSYIKLNDILKWISNNFNRLEKSLSTQKRWLDIDFVCRRGALKTLLCSPYKKSDGWTICASKYRGTIYLCEFYTDEKEYKHKNQTMIQKQSTSSGYKFEQYMVADHPSHKPDLSTPLNECEAFHLMFKAEFGGHSLLYETEIDGILSQQPITDTLIGKTFEVIELKTFLMHNIHKISPERALTWWAQNYLGGVKKVTCGLKDKNFTVKMIKEYPTDGSLELLTNPCNLNKCKIFCNVFLDNVKRIVTKDYNECMYKFHWNASDKNDINYSEGDPNNGMYLFLEPWFVNEAEKYKNTSQ